MKKTVLVAGAVGVIGRSVLAYYEDKDVNLIAISRTKPDFATWATHLPLDLLDPSSSEEHSAALSSVTHLVFAAYQEKPTPAELVDVNMQMLQNLIEALEKHSPDFQHVTLMQGGKLTDAISVHSLHQRKSQTHATCRLTFTTTRKISYASTVRVKNGHGQHCVQRR